MIAVANAQSRLAALGTSLVVDSWPVAVNQVFDRMEMGSQVGLPGRGGLGPEGDRSGRHCPAVLPADPRRRSPWAHRNAGGTSTCWTARSGVVVELARSRVDGADGVSISLRRNGMLMTVAATDDTIRAMDADQYDTGEGPCVDASEKGNWFHVESLESETWWPSFTPRARQLGIKVLWSSPLTSVDQSVGALNIYSLTAETFEDKDQESAAAVAAQASVILSAARAGVDDSERAQRL